MALQRVLQVPATLNQNSARFAAQEAERDVYLHMAIAALERRLRHLRWPQRSGRTAIDGPCWLGARWKNVRQRAYRCCGCVLIVGGVGGTRYLALSDGRHGAGRVLSGERRLMVPTPGTVLRVIVLTLWLVAAGYFATGGWLTVDLQERIRQVLKDRPEGDPVIVDGVEFDTVEDAKLALTQRRVHRLFPWATGLEGASALILFAGSFGALGGVVRLLKQRIIDGRPFRELHVFFGPPFSFLLGLMLLGVAIVLPTALATGGETHPRSLALLILCLFGGAMSGRLYRWFESLLGKFFSTQDGGARP